MAWSDIQTALTTVSPAGQRLHWTGEVDANDNSSAITYDKGALFLRTIERIVGRTRLDTYLRSYFDRYAFQPMTTQQFLADFRQHVVRNDVALEAQLMLDQWAYEPGIPSNAQAPVRSGFNEIPELRRSRSSPAVRQPQRRGSIGTRCSVNASCKRCRVELPAERLQALESSFALDTIGNMEVRFDWLSLAINNSYEPSSAAIERFLSEQGRGKFIRPLYRALMQRGAWGQALARRTYAHARAGYHPIVASAPWIAFSRAKRTMDRRSLPTAGRRSIFRA